MHVEELLYRVAKHGVTLRCDRSEERLHYAPTGALPPDLLAGLQEHKLTIIRILREDEEFRQTGIVQCERQVFELARDHFGGDRST
jgi:hypothetical protein